MSIVANDPDASEVGPDSGQFTVSIGTSLSYNLTVYYDITGTATNGTDYMTISGSVEIPMGMTSATIDIEPWPDSEAEGPESVTLEITSGAYTIGSASSDTVTIADTPLPEVSIVANDPDASEVGPDAGQFTVSIGSSLSYNLTVYYDVSGTATNGTDYMTISGSVEITMGMTSATIEIEPWPDSEAEGPETVILTLTPDSGYGIDSLAETDTVTIADTPLPEVSIVANDPNASEVGPDSGQFTVSIGSSLSYNLTVYYDVSGTATNGTDYMTLSGSAEIPMGMTSATIDIEPWPDSEAEGPETVILTITSDSAYDIDSMAESDTVTIADTPLPTVTITANDPDAWEFGPDSGQFTVSIDNSLSYNLTVNYTISGTATNGTDYSSLSGSVELPMGMISGTIDVDPWPDSETEGPETVVLTLSPDAGYTLGFADNDTVTIADMPTVELIEYRPTGAGTTGQLSEDNPDGDGVTTPAFGGGWRFFPGPTNHESTNPNNIVRIRAKVTPVVEGVRVYFRSFDVDDPATDQYIDPNDWLWLGGGLSPVFFQNTGSDNVGTFVDDSNPTAPGAPNGSGYEGKLREWYPEGLLPDWSEDGEVVSAWTDSDGYAYVELATTFAPGDNFRVAASTDETQFSSTLDVPTTGAPAGFEGKVTDQLSVWRWLHLEQDVMATTDSEDTMDGLLTNSGAPNADGEVTVTITVVGAVIEDEFEGGWLRDLNNGKNYAVKGNTAADPVADPMDNTISVVVSSSAALPELIFVRLYQDDFRPAGNAVPETIIDTELTFGLYDRLQSSTAIAENPFAAAYIEPRTGSIPASWNDTIPANPRIGDNDTVASSTVANRQTKDVESALFWVAYVSTAYEPIASKDLDPNTEGGFGGQTSGVDREASVIYVETVRDLWTATGEVLDYPAMRAHIVAHEVGHQFGLGHRNDPPFDLNIMNESLSEEVLGTPFAAPDIRTMRTTIRPGGDGAGGGAILVGDNGHDAPLEPEHHAHDQPEDRRRVAQPSPRAKRLFALEHAFLTSISEGTPQDHFALPNHENRTQFPTPGATLPITYQSAQAASLDAVFPDDHLIISPRLRLDALKKHSSLQSRISVEVFDQVWRSFSQDPAFISTRVLD